MSASPKTQAASASPVLIRGGRVIDPANGIDRVMDVLLDGGKILELRKSRGIGARDKKKSPGEIFDARGLIVAPGFVDLHVHLREPGQTHKENIASGTRAAAAGGFTSVCAMPNTEPVNDSPEITAWMREPARGAQVNVFPVAAATMGSAGERLSDYRGLRKAGAVAVTDDGKPILDAVVMRKALDAAAAVNCPVIQHAEDTRLTAGGSMNSGTIAFWLGLRGMPPKAESGIVERDIGIVAQTSGHLHVAHISTAAAVQAVRRAKKDGVRVTCEVTPHHLALGDEALTWEGSRLYDSNFKMSPPLRSRCDRDALLEAVADGTIDAIATDHAPHANYEKEIPFEEAPFGITGLETALGIVISQLYQKKLISLRRVIELLSSNPARIVNIGRGSLSPGEPADVTIFDPQKRWTYNLEASASRSRNSPFGGQEFTGMVMATIVGGRFVYRV